MEYRAKLFRNGGSQAVRLPKDCRFEGEVEVVVRREGRRLILEPVDEWPEVARAAIGGWDEPIERPDQPNVGELRDPFE